MLGKPHANYFGARGSRFFRSSGIGVVYWSSINKPVTCSSRFESWCSMTLTIQTTPEHMIIFIPESLHLYYVTCNQNILTRTLHHSKYTQKHYPITSSVNQTCTETLDSYLNLHSKVFIIPEFTLCMN